MSAPGHPIERLVDLLDDRLPGAEAEEVRRHLQGCRECRREFAWLAAGRAAAVGARTNDPVPDDVRAGLAAALDGVDRDAPSLAAGPGRRAVLTGLAAAAAVLFYIAGPWRVSTPDTVDEARLGFEAVRDGTVVYGLSSTDATDLERYFNETVTGPRIRVIDLAMMGWALEGGAHRQLAGRPSALYGYRSATGSRLVCQMFPGRLPDLPAADQTRRENGFEFRVYTRAGVTLVFWQEGELVCVLASDLPAAEVVALAVAKAMAPTRP